MRVVAIWVALLPVSCLAEVFYGFADTTLEVSQQELEGASGYRTLRTYIEPVTVLYRVATDFATSELLGIDLNIHKTIYEDVSQNFEFTFSIEGTIRGAGPVDIDIAAGTDEWASELFWDTLDADITLKRRVFNSVSHFQTHVFDDTVRLANDRLNFTDFPDSITYLRQVAGSYWPLESVPYSDVGRLGFFLRSPGTVTLAPAICTHVACGDYNGNRVVDAADYVVWRKTLGQTGPDLRADGNDNDKVEAADYYVWRTNFGKRRDFAAGQAVPEPSAWLLSCLALYCVRRTLR